MLRYHEQSSIIHVSLLKLYLLVTIFGHLSSIQNEIPITLSQLVFLNGETFYKGTLALSAEQSLLYK